MPKDHAATLDTPAAPRISVVMGIHNDAERGARALASILAQDGVDVELVVVDDGSTDDTPAMLARAAAADARLRVIRQESAGLTAALVRGCNAARGVYIARQDSDDFSLPERLARQAAVLDAHADVVLVSCWVRCLTPHGDVFRCIEPPVDIDETTRLLREEMTGVPAHGSVMFRRAAYEQVGGYRPEFFYSQDCDLWLRLAPCGRIACVGEHLYDLHCGLDSISTAKRCQQMRFARLAQECHAVRCAGGAESAVLEKVAALRRVARNDATLVTRVSRRDRALSLAAMASGLRQRGEIQASRRYLRQALRDCPWAPRLWWAWLRSLKRPRIGHCVG